MAKKKEKCSSCMKHEVKKKMSKKKALETPKARKKISRVMEEFKEGELHSGPKGPKVKKEKQAIAIALSEARRSMKKRKQK